MSEATEKENCTRCVYALATQKQQAGLPEVGAVIYTCRYSPPVPFLMPTGNQSANLIAMFPIVHDRILCSRFEPDPTK